jgi:hypothetical protein
MYASPQAGRLDNFYNDDHFYFVGFVSLHDEIDLDCAVDRALVFLGLEQAARVRRSVEIVW